MARRGRPPAPREVFSFEDPAWSPPAAMVLDTSVVVEAMLPSQPSSKACQLFLERLVASGCAVVFNRLLEVELWEAVFRLVLRERYGSKRWREYRRDGRARRRGRRRLDQARAAWQDDVLASVPWTRVELDSVAAAVPELMSGFGLASYDAVHVATALSQGLTDVATLDTDFALVPASQLTVHTTSTRLAHCRALRS